MRNVRVHFGTFDLISDGIFSPVGRGAFFFVPWAGPNGPHRRQDGDKIAPRWSKLVDASSPHDGRGGQAGPKMVQDCIQTAETSNEESQKYSSYGLGENEPKRRLDGDRMAPRFPNMVEVRSLSPMVCVAWYWR